MKKLFVAVLAVAVMAGCSSEPEKPAGGESAKPKGTPTLTGRSGFQRCFVAARGWARDAQLYRLESQIGPGSNGQDGKAPAWRAGFASASMTGTRTFMWSGEDVMPGVQDSYNPRNTSTQVFDIGFLKIDSDQALAEANKHGGDKILEKEKDTAVFYILAWDRQDNLLVWHVIYGPDPDNAKLRVAVNATSGEFIKVEK
jgi:hypothetical protein